MIAMFRRMGTDCKALCRTAFTALILAGVAACATTPTGPRPVPPGPTGPVVTDPNPRPPVDRPVVPAPDDRPVIVDERPVVVDRTLTPPFMNPSVTRRIALLAPFSDSRSGVQAEAANLLDAAQLALFATGDSDVLLIPEDTGGTSDGARAAAERAIEQGADVILGPLFADSVRAVSGPARAANVPVIAFSSDRAVAGNGVYLLSFAPEEEVERLMAYMVENDLMTLAILAPENEFGRRLARTANEAANWQGALVTGQAFYGRSPQEITRAARDLAGQLAAQTPPPPPNSEPDFSTTANALFLPDGGANLRTAAPLAFSVGLDPTRVQYLGTSQWNDPALWREPPLQNGWFVGPDPTARDDFDARFTAAYGRDPSQIASLAYDATFLTIILTDNRERSLDLRALTDPEGYVGADGLFRFTPDGYTQRALAIYRVRNGQAEVISPAASRFPDVGF